jgi:hypothetical protein
MTAWSIPMAGPALNAAARRTDRTGRGGRALPRPSVPARSAGVAWWMQTYQGMPQGAAVARPEAGR